MPKQGASSGFKYGRAVGAIEAAITLCAIPVEIVEPSVWKRFWKLPGKDKESGRQKALQLFLAAHGMLARRRDHNRAESALIALYGASTCTWAYDEAPDPTPILEATLIAGAQQ